MVQVTNDPAEQAPRPQDAAVPDPIPAWPGHLVSLRSGEVFVRTGPAAQNSEPALFIHGLGGSSTNWTDLMDFLARPSDARPAAPVLAGAAIDLPGFGCSPAPPGGDYSISAHARAVIEFVESGQPGPVHLIGNSMGGAVALRAAARRPDLIRTLTLISAALPDRRPHRQTIHFPVIAVPLLGDRLVERFSRIPAENRIWGVIQACYCNPAAIHPSRLAESVVELRRRDELGYSVAVITGAARTLVAETLRPHWFSLWRDAERLFMPALVLFGDHDRLVSPDLAARAARAFHGARVEVLSETGHLGQMEHPAVVASLFREMVDGIGAAPDSGETPGNAGQRAPVDA